MAWETGFQVASTVALAGWVGLIALPRWAALLTFIRYGIVGLLAGAYAVLVTLYLFRVEGGGFGSLAAVKQLLSSDPVILAGWIHYLAFDLFVGVWIAVRADEQGLSRLAQVPILLATFMLGPLGLLLFYAVAGALALVRGRSKGS